MLKEKIESLLRRSAELSKRSAELTRQSHELVEKSKAMTGGTRTPLEVKTVPEIAVSPLKNSL